MKNRMLALKFLAGFLVSTIFFFSLFVWYAITHDGDVAITGWVYVIWYPLVISVGSLVCWIFINGYLFVYWLIQKYWP